MATNVDFATYVCKESGMTDLEIMALAHITNGRLNKGQFGEELAWLRRYGADVDSIHASMGGHIIECQDCRKLYDAEIELNDFINSSPSYGRRR